MEHKFSQLYFYKIKTFKIWLVLRKITLTFQGFKKLSLHLEVADHILQLIPLIFFDFIFNSWASIFYLERET